MPKSLLAAQAHHVRTFAMAVCFNNNTDSIYGSIVCSVWSFGQFLDHDLVATVNQGADGEAFTIILEAPGSEPASMIVSALHHHLLPRPLCATAFSVPSPGCHTVHSCPVASETV